MASIYMNRIKETDNTEEDAIISLISAIFLKAREDYINGLIKLKNNRNNLYYNKLISDVECFIHSDWAESLLEFSSIEYLSVVEEFTRIKKIYFGKELV